MRASKHVPRSVRAVLNALRLTGANPNGLRELSDEEWREALAFCDNARLTLALGAVSGDCAPDWVRRRLSGNLTANDERRRRLWIVYDEIARALRDAGVPFVVLKGFTHWPDFVADPRLRVQYDLDLYCLPETVRVAYEAAAGLGYEPLRGFEQFPSDHLPALIRKTGWEWRGDYFDPDFPASLELHFRLWNPATEKFAPSGLDGFWGRRVERKMEGRSIPVLQRADALGYACLHLLRHLFRGHLRAYQIHEVACFLHRCADDDEFWAEWRTLHDDSLRRLEMICFGLAREWFGCRLAVEESGRRWIDEYGEAPLDALWHPNKDELWLHLSLVESARDKAAVLMRRLAPLRLAGPVDAIHVPEERVTWRRRARAWGRYVRFLTARMLWHARSLRSLVASGWRWWRG